MDNKQRSLFEEIVLCNGFTPTISVATHLKPNTKLSCIDNILTNNVENVLKSGVIEAHISHHRSLYLALKSSLKANSAEPKVKPKMVIKYDYSQENLSQLNAILSKKLSQNGQIKTFTDFITIFSTSIDEACKLKVSKFSKRNRIVNPWITTALINSISKRDRLYKIWNKTTTKLCKSGDPRLFEEYRRYRNKLSLLIKTAKQQHYSHKLLNSTGNLKQTWAAINELRGKSKASASSFSQSIILC